MTPARGAARHGGCLICSRALRATATLWPRVWRAVSPLTRARAQERLRAAGSALARKWPRCSLRSKQKYSDASVRLFFPLLLCSGSPFFSLCNPPQADTSQMEILTAIWLAFLALGAACVACAAVGAASDAHLLALAPPLPPVLRGGGGAALALCGAGLAGVAVRSLATLRKGTLVAVKGDCPACGEEVYAFVGAQAKHPGKSVTQHARHAADCHVCARPLAFDVRVRGAPGAPPWRRRAHGRIYLVSRNADFFPPASQEAEAAPSGR